MANIEFVNSPYICSKKEISGIMKKENSIRVEMFRMRGDVAPFVKVDYMDKYAEEHTGLMLLDSGSMGNVLSNEMADGIGTLCKLEDEGVIVHSIANEVMKSNNVRFSFAMGGRQFHDTFCLSTNALPIQVKGMKVVGILGIRFLKQHGLVIDYSDYSLHTSCVNPDNLSISDCDYFFPMEIGLNNYGLPVVAVIQNKKEIVALVDTGATSNMIAKQTVNSHNFNCSRTNEKDVMMGITGEVEVEEAIIKFNLATLTGTSIKQLSRHANFYLLPHYVFTPSEEFCDAKDEQRPPIEVAIGSPFMARQGWVIDFGAKIIYRRRKTNALREAV